MNKRENEHAASLLIANKKLEEANKALQYELTIAQKPGQSPGDDKTDDNRHDKNWPAPGTRPKEGDRPNQNLFPLAHGPGQEDIRDKFSYRTDVDPDHPDYGILMIDPKRDGNPRPATRKEEESYRLQQLQYEEHPYERYPHEHGDNYGLQISPKLAQAPQQIRGRVPHGIIFKSGGPHIDSPYIDNLIKRNGQPMRIQDIKPGGPQLPWFLAQGSSEQIRGALKPWTTGKDQWTKEGGSWKYDNMPPFLQKQILKDASA